MSLLLLFRFHGASTGGTPLPVWGFDRTVASRMPTRTVTNGPQYLVASAAGFLRRVTGGAHYTIGTRLPARVVRRRGQE